MKIAGMARIATLTVLIALSTSRDPIQAQIAPSGLATIESINTEYEKAVHQLDRQRLESFGRLALSQPRAQAAITYDAYFRLAIAKNLYADALPLANRVIQSEDPHASISWLAHLVQIVAEADKGDYEGSFKSLATAIRMKQADPKAATKPGGLSIGTQASIVDAYYQRLIHADQIEVARKAMKLVADSAEAAPIRDLAGRRLKQLELIGKPAPAISGSDIDGKPFKLADTKGEVVLVVFWATWCLPNAQQMPMLDYINNAYKGKGLRVIGVNLDAAQDGSHDPKAVLPMIHRYLLDYNVTWPTLLNGPGDNDIAAAFGVTEIPASVLIGRDGTIKHLDLVGRKLEKAIADALAQKP